MGERKPNPKDVLKNRWQPFLTGISRKGRALDDDKWYRENVVDLLNAHYALTPNNALSDVLSMMLTDEAQLTTSRTSKKDGNPDDEQYLDQLNPPAKHRKLRPSEKALIRDWYNKIDATLCQYSIFETMTFHDFGPCRAPKMRPSRRRILIADFCFKNPARINIPPFQTTSKHQNHSKTTVK